MSVRSRRSVSQSSSSIPDIPEEEDEEGEDESEEEDTLGEAIDDESPDESLNSSRNEIEVPELQDYPIVQERLSNIDSMFSNMPRAFSQFTDQLSSLLTPILVVPTGVFGNINGLNWNNKKAAQESQRVTEYLEEEPDIIKSEPGGHTAWVDKGGHNCIIIQDTSQLGYLPQTHLLTSHVNRTMDIPNDKARKIHKIHQMVDYNPSDGSLWVACDSYGSCIATLAAIKAYADGAVRSTQNAAQMARNWSNGAQNGAVLTSLEEYVQNDE